MAITKKTRLIVLNFCKTFYFIIPVYSPLAFLILSCAFNQTTNAQELDSNTNLIRTEDERIIDETRREVFDINNRSSNPQEEQEVHLIPDKTSVKIGEQVNLRADLNYEDQSASYRFSLRGSNWYQGFQNENEVIFDQFDAEDVYHFIVEVKVRGIDELLIAVCRVVARIEDVEESLEVNLDANKTQAEIGEVINFEAFVNPDRDEILYHFNFGNEYPTEPVWDNKISHSYRFPGEYTATVQLLTPEHERLARSNPIIITIIPSGADKIIEPPPPPKQTSDWWKYIIVSLAILITVGYSIKPFSKSQVTLHAYPDSGQQSFEKQNDLRIDMKFILNPNLSIAKYLLDTNGKKFITSLRRKK